MEHTWPLGGTEVCGFWKLLQSPLSTPPLSSPGLVGALLALRERLCDQIATLTAQPIRQPRAFLSVAGS
jgi:hypothetical protein